MNERMNESLSALVDGEADELEVRRLLNQAQTDDALRATWRRYQMIGALMRSESVSYVDLSKGINQAIDGEPMDDLTPAHKTQSVAVWPKWLASGAVAASVTLAVLLGVQWQQADNSMLAVAPDNNMTIPTQVAAIAPMSAAEQAQLEQAQRKLQEYVLQHNEQATESPARSMLPYARTVNFQQESTQP